MAGFETRWEKLCEKTPELRDPENIVKNITVAVLKKIAKKFWDAALLDKMGREELAKKFEKSGKKEESFEDIFKGMGDMFGGGKSNPFSR